MSSMTRGSLAQEYHGLEVRRLALNSQLRQSGADAYDALLEEIDLIDGRQEEIRRRHPWVNSWSIKGTLHAPAEEPSGYLVDLVARKVGPLLRAA